MRFLLLIYSDENAEFKTSKPEMERVMSAFMAYTDALKKAGAYIGGNRLKPTNTASSVRVANGKTKVVDGPYAETKEQLGGYYLIDASDLDAAIAWAARCPGASNGTMEVRPVWPT